MKSIKLSLYRGLNLISAEERIRLEFDKRIFDKRIDINTSYPIFEALYLEIRYGKV